MPTAQRKSFVKAAKRKPASRKAKKRGDVPRDVPRKGVFSTVSMREKREAVEKLCQPRTEDVYVDLRLPRPVFNTLRRAAEIAQMDQASVSLALIALALAQAEDVARRTGVTPEPR